MAEEQASREVPTLERPAGGFPASFEEYAKLMFDLQVLAYQTDLTRVITFMMAHERSSRTYREIGIPDAHHPLSHHRDDPGQIAKLVKINTYHVKLFAYYLEKLRSTPDGDGTLLDHSMILYGSGHQRRQLAYARQPAHPVGGRGSGQDQRRPSHPVSRRERR